MPLSDATIKDAVERYRRERDRYLKLSARVAEICREELVEANAIRAQVTFRAKSEKSFEGKLRRNAGAWTHADSVEGVFSFVRDLAAARVSTYAKGSEEKVVGELVKRFTDGAGGAVVPVEKDKHINKPENFYRATHCEVFLRPGELVGTYANLAGTPCEVQVCSIMAHVWNEVEHDLGYKPTTGALSEAERELLVSLGHLTRSGDGVISRLFDATETRQRELNGPFEDVFDFVARMRKWLPGADLTRHAGQLFDELLALGVTTPELVKQQSGGEDAELADARTKLQTFATYLTGNGHDRYTLDPDSSDLLLILLLPALAQRIVDNHPTGRGVGGPPRVAWLASRFLESVALQAANA